MVQQVPMVVGVAQLAAGDWLVLGGYFAALIGASVWASRGGAKSTEDYFLASRSMPVWAVAFSILSTAQSAATYVGVPQSSYAGDLTYLSSSIGGIVAAIVLATVFIPAYYRLGVGTPYELLSRRFGEAGRIAAATAYLAGRVFASGARVFVAAIPAAIVIFGEGAGAREQAVLIVFFTLLGIGLCFFGGVRSVIWLDVLQVTVYLGAAIATIVVLWLRIPAGTGAVLEALQHPGAVPGVAGGLGGVGGDASKLTVISLSWDLSKQFTLWTALTGFVLLTIASHGADQDLVQRMLTCRSASKGAWSVISGVLIGVPAVLVFLVLGLLLWVFYKRPDLMGGAAPGYEAGGSDSVFQVFALREMRGWGAGLVIAGLFACGPAGINSGLSAMASSFVGDVYRPLRALRRGDARRSAADEAHDLRVGRWATVLAGFALGAMALACTVWYDPRDRTILDFVLSVMTFAYAGLLGVFLAALFTPRGSTWSCIAALVVGGLTQLAFQKPIWELWAGSVRWTETNGGAGIARSLKDYPIAFPWQLLVGGAIAFGVCCLGKASKPARVEPAGRIG